MSSIFLTSEDISNGRISDNAVRNHQWIRQNLHLLDEERLNHWNCINRLKEWNLATAIKWLHLVRYEKDDVYRVNCMGEAIKKQISAIEANEQLEASTERLRASTERLQQDEKTIARGQYQNSDIWVSDRHFR